MGSIDSNSRILIDGSSPPLPSSAVGASLNDELAFVDALVRDLSRKLDPIDLAGLFETATARYFAADRWLTLSRLGLEYPLVRVTRCSDWAQPPDPWREPHKLPMVRGGVLGEWLHDGGNAGPRFIDRPEVPGDDPGLEFLHGMASMAIVPVYDVGRQLHVGVWMWRDADRARTVAQRHLPMMIWLSNLFARTSHALTLRRQLQAALEVVEDEMRVVGRLQDSLLPERMPSVPGVSLASHHQTARRAGGDHYDLSIVEGNLHVFMGDVSGHGAASTVGVGVVHALVHALETHPAVQREPGEAMAWLNTQFTRHYTRGNGRFVTAFYAIYDPRRRQLRYANAGHPPPRMKRGQHVVALPGETGLPLGIDDSERYLTHEVYVSSHDTAVLFTDGLFEVSDRAGRMLGLERLDAWIAECEPGGAQVVVAQLRERLQRFAGSATLSDDAAILAMHVEPSA
jgi:phosphoserine phosphatase RsbU/P